MSWNSRVGILALAALAGAACRVEVGGAEGADPVTVGDTLRFNCAAPPELAGNSIHPLALPVERLLVAGQDLLAVTGEGDLVRLPGGPGPARRLLSGGKDYDLADGAVARLTRDGIDLFGYGRDRLWPIGEPLAVQPHEISLALGATAVHLHSPADPANVLVTARDRRTGEEAADHLPVDRPFLRLLMTDPDQLLAETGRVRSAGEHVVFVPALRDPVVLLGARPLALYLGDDARGVLRTVERVDTFTERPCPTCTEHRTATARQEVHPLYADAAFGDGALWILRLTPPGSSRATLLRVGVERPGRPEVHAWRLAGLDATPTALARQRDRIVVADGRHLHGFPVPALGDGAACASR